MSDERPEDLTDEERIHLVETGALPGSFATAEELGLVPELTDELRAELIRVIDERDALRDLAWKHGNRADEAEAELDAYKYSIEKIQELLARYRETGRYAYVLRSIRTWAEMPPIAIAAEKERARLRK